MNQRDIGRQRLSRPSVVAAALVAALALGALAVPAEASKYLYILSNNVADGQNSVIAYARDANGALTPHSASPFLTRGSGIDNDTNGKLGPNDNDTPLVISADKRRLFAVNGHTNTIAVFDIRGDGSLRHVDGSPFDAMGVGPVSLAISGDVLLVANRNEDPHQLGALRGAAASSYVSFRILPDGRLEYISKIELEDGHKNTQILVSSRNPRIAFGNDFRVDADFDGDGKVSKLFGTAAAVLGRIHSFHIDGQGRLHKTDTKMLPETVDPAPEVPTIPLGIWDHPHKNLLYVGFVTRNQLGVFHYDSNGALEFVTAVPNSGQDICWLKVNAAGTRLYAVNNLPREDMADDGSTVTVFDVSGERAVKPVEIGRVVLPLPLGTFINNRAIAQPNSAAFQLDLDEEDGVLYVISQRIDQTDGNTSALGNVLHTVRIGGSGGLSVADSRHLGPDGVDASARPQGVVTLELD